MTAPEPGQHQIPSGRMILDFVYSEEMTAMSRMIEGYVVTPINHSSKYTYAQRHLAHCIVLVVDCLISSGTSVHLLRFDQSLTPAIIDANNAPTTSFLRSHASERVLKKNLSSPCPWCRRYNPHDVQDSLRYRDSTSIPYWTTAARPRRTARVRSGWRSRCWVCTELPIDCVTLPSNVVTSYGTA